MIQDFNVGRVEKAVRKYLSEMFCIKGTEGFGSVKSDLNVTEFEWNRRTQDTAENRVEGRGIVKRGIGHMEVRPDAQSR